MSMSKSKLNKRWARLVMISIVFTWTYIILCDFYWVLMYVECIQAISCYFDWWSMLCTKLDTIQRVSSLRQIWWSMFGGLKCVVVVKARFNSCYIIYFYYQYCIDFSRCYCSCFRVIDSSRFDDVFIPPGVVMWWRW